MTVSPVKFVTVNTPLGSWFGTICPAPSGTEMCLSQPVRSRPLNSGRHSDFGEATGSAACVPNARPIINEARAGQRDPARRGAFACEEACMGEMLQELIADKRKTV